LTCDQFGEAIERVVCDASFISLRLLLPVMDSILSEAGGAVVLIKPQFEAGRERLGRRHKGVVRDPLLHSIVVTEILTFAIQETRLRPTDLSWSPILGPEGNVEFLCRLERTDSALGFGFDCGFDVKMKAAAVVEAAHRELKPQTAATVHA
jgi:23S rRNA (cytidine1920-2'-O)/16S rRNA (cytidine1409-2'-O)-methyltransferase